MVQSIDEHMREELAVNQPLHIVSLIEAIFYKKYNPVCTVP